MRFVSQNWSLSVQDLDNMDEECLEIVEIRMFVFLFPQTVHTFA